MFNKYRFHKILPSSLGKTLLNKISKLEILRKKKNQKCYDLEPSTRGENLCLLTIQEQPPLSSNVIAPVANSERTEVPTTAVAVKYPVVYRQDVRAAGWTFWRRCGRHGCPSSLVVDVLRKRKVVVPDVLAGVLQVVFHGSRFMDRKVSRSKPLMDPIFW